MAHPRSIPVLSIGGGATVVVAALEHYLWRRQGQRQDICLLHTSEALRRQSDRIQIDGLAPEATLPDDVAPEFFDVTLDHTVCRVRSSGIEIFQGYAVDHAHLRDQLLSGPVVVVLDPWQDYALAVHSVRARAYFLQEHLGLEAGTALLHSLNQHFRIDSADIARQDPRFAALVESLGSAQWGLELTESEPARRYPIEGNAVPAGEFDRLLDALILAQTRRNDRARQLLRQVLATVERVIVTYSRLDWLSSLPGVQFDAVGLANDLTAPRPGVCIVTGKYVDHHQDPAAERIEHFEGYCDEAAERLWNTLSVAIKGTKPARRLSVPRIDWQLRSTPALIIAVALPLVLVILTMLVGFGLPMIVVGVLAAIAGEAICIHQAFFGEARERTSEVPMATPARPQAVDVPPAIAARSSALPETNGHLHV